ncbi:A/G-specific adenine glycosylase [uncultured Veillonella sp.]|uniref:A/G-specific adenine glycosylase n=1 Tax=uncultured Veillonella sp. TaxID=159268 RepID=UPI0026009867|nr:A/G-specific adenine glycosylase [uncultured Veillonella sp.]MDY3974602.1 A/G-specific adenine glycosylase [Veillonella caviae]
MVNNEISLESKWTDELLAWYDIHKRDLPWREMKDPYKVWVSEIMSQQTRIEAMKPYYENWMRLFPTKEALAAASEDEVVRAWQGLGYYSRARNLRLGVQEVMQRYGGEIPKNRKDLESIKGIGAYTAGAVLSIVYNMREAAIDGNVLRVYARLYKVHEDIMRSAGKKKITALVEATLPAHRPGDFNQALMDFGSRVCIPKSPRCQECPLVPWCEAHKAGVEAELPTRIVNKKVPIISVVTGLLYNEKGEYLLHRRPNTGLLQSMWEFPSVEVPREEFLDKKVEVTPVGIKPLEDLLVTLGLTGTVKEERITRLRHVFSHRCWDMEAYSVEISSALECTVDENWRWVKPADFIHLPWAGPHGKLTVYCKA